MSAPHVLLVDPSTTRDVLSERLRMQGYVVTATADPGVAAHLALSDPPAIVVADLWMPGISGAQLCRLLRSEPATEAVPIILRGPEQRLRDRFWAERAGAVAYVTRGRMGDLVRALAAAIAASPPPTDTFFTQLSGGELDLRDRIAAHLDSALFESVVASEVRALSVCGTFVRLFDLLSQFLAQVTSYRWLAVYTARPERFGLHAHPAVRAQAEAEARRALGIADDVPVVAVEDEDAVDDPDGPPPRLEGIRLGAQTIGRVALAPRHPMEGQDAELTRIIARELGGPIRIATLMEESHRLATLDSLTGLLNRRAFTAALQGALARCTRERASLAVLLLDLDHFKLINDQHGHPIGDLVLAQLGRLLEAQARESDVVGRWGGEEFVVALTGANDAGAAQAAERIRAAIAAMIVRGGQDTIIPVTASIGASVCVHGDTVDALIDRADRAMYAAKSGGRNRVAIAPPRTIVAAPGVREAI